MKYNKPQGDPAKTFLMIIIGACLIVAVDLFVLGGKEQIFKKRTTPDPLNIGELQQKHARYMHDGVVYEEGITFARAPVQMPKEEIPYLSELEGEPVYTDKIETARLASMPQIYPSLGEMYKEEQKTHKAEVIEEIDETPKVDKTKYKYTNPEGQGVVVVIIDDMGLSHRSRDVENLPGPLTLSYLPYADNLPEKTAYAKSKGHELMVHVPMEPINGNLDGGPAVLKTGMNKDEFKKTLKDDLSQFTGFVGINNHMGSRLTQDDAAMRLVMAELKQRGVYFVDSKTIGSSVGAEIAAETGIPYAERDVFLDHEMTPEFVSKALSQLENKARKNGYAIAIGHPHQVTIDALTAWLPTLKDKGLTLAPASAVVKRPQAPLMAEIKHTDLLPHEIEPAVGLSATEPEEQLDADEGMQWEEMDALSAPQAETHRHNH